MQCRGCSLQSTPACKGHHCVTTATHVNTTASLASTRAPGQSDQFDPICDPRGPAPWSGRSGCSRSDCRRRWPTSPPPRPRPGAPGNEWSCGESPPPHLLVGVPDYPPPPVGLRRTEDQNRHHFKICLYFCCSRWTIFLQRVGGCD